MLPNGFLISDNTERYDGTPKLGHTTRAEIPTILYTVQHSDCLLMTISKRIISRHHTQLLNGHIIHIIYIQNET